MQAMLGHGQRDHRQLGNLVTLRRGCLDPLALAEGMSAADATRRPVLDHLVELLERKQPPVPAFVPGLAGPAPARRRPRPRRRRGRILRGRQRGVTRGAAQPLLKLTDPSLRPPVRLDQLVHPHQQCDRRLPIAVENRLRLGPLHTPEFAPPNRVPSGEVNAYRKGPVSGAFPVAGARYGPTSDRAIPVEARAPCTPMVAGAATLTLDVAL
jgi:hypothetical protein